MFLKKLTKTFIDINKITSLKQIIQQTLIKNLNIAVTRSDT
jgi:hypothetical protein